MEIDPAGAVWQLLNPARELERVGSLILLTDPGSASEYRLLGDFRAILGTYLDLFRETAADVDG